MGTTQPIRKCEEIENLKEYFMKKDEIRNYVLITMGINTALRIGDLLKLKWGDVWNFVGNCFRQHITLLEQKTGKPQIIYLNAACRECLGLYIAKLERPICEGMYIFQSRVGTNRPIGRNRAYTIIKNAWHDLGYEGNVSCHSLRKTFGYHAWHKGVSPAVIMTIYNHSSMDITKRYLSIEQDEKDYVYQNMVL
jgi:integrase